MDKDYSERDGVDPMSRGSVSSDLGDTWHQGLPTSPQWEGGLELGLDDNSESTEEDEREDWSCEKLGRGVEGAARDYNSEVRADVLVQRTAGPKWYDAKLYKEFAEL